MRRVLSSRTERPYLHARAAYTACSRNRSSSAACHAPAPRARPPLPTDFLNNSVYHECNACASRFGGEAQDNCPANSSLAAVNLTAGFWRISDAATTASVCPISKEEPQPCAGGMNAGVDGEGYCSEGYYGPLCRLCTEDDFYFDSTKARVSPHLLTSPCASRRISSHLLCISPHLLTSPCISPHLLTPPCTSGSLCASCL